MTHLLATMICIKKKWPLVQKNTMCARPLRLHAMWIINDTKHCNQLIGDHSSSQIHCEFINEDLL